MPVEANKEVAAVPKGPQPAPEASLGIFVGARPADTAAQEHEVEARLVAGQCEGRRASTYLLPGTFSGQPQGRLRAAL
ncbi:hypothetical protein MTO96_050046 [Rhipicephalus appendiculatus]